MRTLARFLLTPQNLAGLAIVLAFIGIAVASPALAPFDDDPNVPPYFSRVGRRTDTVPHPPSTEAPLGTLAGQFNVYYTVIWGTRSALRFGIIVAAATATLGVLVGAVSGYAGGWVQRITIPVTDAFLAFPAIAGYWVVRYSLFPADPNVLTTFVQGLVVRLGLDPLMVALILFSWMPYARITSTSTMRLRQIEYVQAARALGAGGVRIVLRHIVPNLLAPIIVLAARDVGGTVMLAAAFTFIGIGGDLPWGELLAIGRDWIIGPGGSLTAYWWIYGPVTAALLLFGIGWNLLGDGVNDLIAGRRSPTVVDIARRKWSLPAAGLILGVALGLIYSWAIHPARIVDTRPEQLRAEFQQDYLRAAADSFSLTMDVSTALRRFEALGGSATASLRPLRRPQVAAPDPLIEGYAFVIDSLGADAEPSRPLASPRVSLPTWGAVGLAAAILTGGVAAVVPRWRRRRGAPSPSPTSAPSAAPPIPAVLAPIRPQAPVESRIFGTFHAEFSPTDGDAEPAFVIENAAGEFLGECGVSSSELVAAGPPALAPALEIWLFDKHRLQTVNAFVIPPGAASDSDFHHRLTGRGEVHAAQDGLHFHLASRTLRLDVQLNRIECSAHAPGRPAGIRRASLDLQVVPQPTRAF